MLFPFRNTTFFKIMTSNHYAIDVSVLIYVAFSQSSQLQLVLQGDQTKRRYC